jgi:hypothetical protein
MVGEGCPWPAIALHLDRPCVGLTYGLGSGLPCSRATCIGAFRVERHFSAVRGSELLASIAVFCLFVSQQTVA